MASIAYGQSKREFFLFLNGEFYSKEQEIVGLDLTVSSQSSEAGALNSEVSTTELIPVDVG